MWQSQQPLINVIQGPSLLRTCHYRPQPSLLHLPGLRSGLPFWTQLPVLSPLSTSGIGSYDNSNHHHEKQQEQQEQQQQQQDNAIRQLQQLNRVAYQDPQVSQAVSLLQDSWFTIRDEYQRATTMIGHQQQQGGGVDGDHHPDHHHPRRMVANDYQTETEHSTLHEGTWEWHSYMRKGSTAITATASNGNTFATTFPQTTMILQELSRASLLFEGTPFGYAFFSTLHGQSRIAPHHAPMNLRLRIHLPLIVPDLPSSNRKTKDDDDDRTIQDMRPTCGIRVGPDIRSWHEGIVMVFDDAYEHEVWNETNTKRVILLVDIWHPDVTMSERRDIVDLFRHAQAQGWWKQS